MKKGLQNFDLLCQQIINQKKHGILHNLRPFARKKVYVQEDFMTLWNNSGFKKFKYALQSADLNFKYTEIEVPNGQRDIYQGTTRPGVLLRYKVDPKDQLYLITQLLARLKQNTTNDDLATWRGFIQEQITQCKQKKTKFSLPMQLHIIARIKPKANQSFQSKKASQISQFNSLGYNGNIYVWFDFSKYKDELKNALDKNKQVENNDQELIKQQADQDEEIKNIHFTNPIQDKIKIGQFQMNVKDSQKQGILGITQHVLQGDINDFIGNAAVKGFNRLRGVGERKDSSQDPDFIRKKLSLFDMTKPFVQVISTVTLNDWLYNLTQDPQKKYLGSSTKRINITGLIKFPFEIKKIKRSGDPLLSDDISTNQCWTKGSMPGSKDWQRQPIKKDWLLNTDEDHKITLKFQSWVKSQNGYYFDYRIVLDLNTFYKNKEIIAKKEQELSNLSSREYYQANKLKKDIAEKKTQAGNFKIWLGNYIKKNLDKSCSQDQRILIQKNVFDSKGFVNKDGPVASKLWQLKYRDSSAFDYLIGLLERNWKCEGEDLQKIMDSVSQ